MPNLAAPPIINQLIVGCPHCHVNLKISKDYENRGVNCPQCRGQFTVPRFEDSKSDTSSLTGTAHYAVIIGGHVVLALLILLVFKVVWPIVLIAFVEIAYYFRKWIATKTLVLIRDFQTRKAEGKSQHQNLSATPSPRNVSNPHQAPPRQLPVPDSRSQNVRTSQSKPPLQTAGKESNAPLPPGATPIISGKEIPYLPAHLRPKPPAQPTKAKQSLPPLINSELAAKTRIENQAAFPPKNDTNPDASPSIVGIQYTPPVKPTVSSSTTRAELIPPRVVPPVIKPHPPTQPQHQQPSRLLPSLVTTIRSVFGGNASLNELGSSLPKDAAFFGPNSILLLDRGNLDSPLVYATSNAHFGSHDPSLIDGTLPVASDRSRTVESLPYWPNYYDASPQQRSRYLEWLLSGRQDPNIEVGYVFIYFYGLERRLLVDDADHQAIVDEVLRLRPIYSHSRSFQRYTQSFLWTALGLDAKKRNLSQLTIERILSLSDRWGEEGVDRYLAYLYESGQALLADTAFHVTKSLEGAKNSVIVKRHNQLFQELFSKKFQEKFPDGLALKASRRARQLTYQPASAALARSFAMSNNGRFGEIPNVLGIESQFKPLIAIWELCIEELRDYDRAHRNSGGSSASAYETLPEELRDGAHPDHEAWHSLWKRTDNLTSPITVTLSELAVLKGISFRATLLKSQCQDILRTADALGIGIEPDVRLTGKNYQWEQPVVLFHRDDIKAEDPAPYLAATTLLQLGICVALADDDPNEPELSVITKQLEDRFDFDKDQSLRLEACRDLLMKHPPNPGKSFSALKKRFSDKERLVLGDYLISIAAADQIVTASEREILRKLFQSLAIPLDVLDKTLQPIVAGLAANSTASSNESASRGFYLNPETIARIANETEAVTAMLSEAMKVDDDEELRESPSAVKIEDIVPENLPQADPKSAVLTDEISDKIPTSAGYTNPPRRFFSFYQELITKDEWSALEAKTLATRHQVMLSGAIAALNDWSQDQWNDLLIEEGDTLKVRLDLLRSKAS